MDCVQYAGHLDQSELNREIHGVVGPLRGVVRARRGGVEGVTGRYTRVWLKNGYGVLVLERHDANGEWDASGLWLVPIRHAGPEFREATWSPLNVDGERLGEGVPLDMVAAPDVTAGADMLRGLSILPGHSMAGVQ
jgi:hypothetical protein